MQNTHNLHAALSDRESLPDEMSEKLVPRLSELVSRLSELVPSQLKLVPSLLKLVPSQF
jgi:hypothetical protein